MIRLIAPRREASLPSVKGILPGFAAACVALTLYFLRSPLSPIELALYDGNFRWFWVETSAPPEIVIVSIDSPSLDALGPFPWPRKRHADVIERVARGGAKAIGVDIGFFEPDGKDPRNDELLIRATAEAGSVVYPTLLEEIEDAGERRVQPLRVMPDLAAVSAGYGHGHLSMGPDEVVRSVNLAGRTKEEVFWRMDFQVLRVYLDLTASAIQAPRPGVVALGSLEIPVSTPRRENGSEWTAAFDHELQIGFAGPTGTFERISALDVIEGRFRRDAFQDRIVMYGGTASELGDAYRTPVSRAQEPTPGVEIQANVVHTLLNRRFLRRAEPAMTIVLTLLASVAVSFLYARTRRAFGLALTLLTAIAAGYVLAFNVLGYWVEVAPILVAVLLSCAASVFHQRAFSDRIAEF